MLDKLIGNEIESAGPKLSQVYTATHSYNGEEWKRSSLMNRSFISFSYGGKFIEDFNLIATISGDRLQKNLYANFEDDVTTYEVIDGQYHWGTHFTNNSFNFTLSTDGITEAQLNEFRYWFKPGIERELVLAESPNRAIMARVAAVPSYSFIPFEEKTTINIESTDYNTSTTLYKGDILLSLVADEPFWYSRSPLIKYYYIDKEDKFGTMQNTHIEGAFSTIDDKDMLKVIVEDNIPYVGILQTDAILADNTYAMLHGNRENIFSQIIAESDEETDLENFYAHIDSAGENETPPIPPSGMIGVVLNEGNDSQYPISLTLSNEDTRHLYYSGTAPAKPTISFTLTPSFRDNYIEYPLNTYSPDNEGNRYNTFSIGEQVMKFTLPSILLGYNQAIAIINDEDYVEGSTYLEDIRQALITGVHEYHARAWAMTSLDHAAESYVNSSTQIIQSGFKSTFITKMKEFVSDNGITCKDVSFSFDSKTGIALGTFNLPSSEIHVEKVGDMLRSGFITITNRNYPCQDITSNHYNYITDNDCTLISTNYPTGLKNVLITFKNMYY